MESKNVKVIDEHGIDREADVMCKIDVDGSDYVVYSIERDGENDNIFISKLVKNNDGTSNMMNIEDTMEKNKLSDIVKELIKHSIDTSEEKTNGVVTLSDGKIVNIGSVLFNKEQNINVGKTYISTVKKSVTKVGENFYKVNNVREVPEVEAVEPVVEMPEIEPQDDTVQPVPSIQEVMDSFVEEPKPEPVAPEVVVPAAPEVAPVMPEVTPVAPVESQPTTEPTPVVPVQQPEPTTPTIPVPPVTPVIPEVAPVVENPQPEAPAPVVPEPAPMVEPTVTETSDLVLDGSKETNLNIALGEVSNDGTVPVNDVESIREFGQDEPTEPVAPATTEPTTPIESAPKSGGFANNKFFIVIAIVFFLAACVFLGYEVWQYFKIAG